MDLVPAIVTAGATLSGSLITAYRDELKNAVLARTKNFDYLRGVWACTWDITSDPTGNRRIVDHVTIRAVNGALIKGEGVSPDGYGCWHAAGKATEFAITLEYSGDNEMKYLAGVVILKKESPSTLNGVWSQYFTDGGLKGGTTVWRKVTA